MQNERFNPRSPGFQANWVAAQAPEVSGDDFDQLVKEVCGANESPLLYSKFVQILGFWLAAAESWNMLNLERLINFDPSLKEFKHELSRELIRVACSSAHSVTSPDSAVIFYVNKQGSIIGGTHVVHTAQRTFNRNLTDSLRLHDYLRTCSQSWTPQLLDCLWYVAMLGGCQHGLSNFDPTDWRAVSWVQSGTDETHFIFMASIYFEAIEAALRPQCRFTHIQTSLDPVTVFEDDMLSLLHIQMQLSAGVCPVVMDQELRKDYACLLANAGGCVLKVVHSSGCLDMDKLRHFIRQALCELRRQSNILIVVVGLATLGNNMGLCSRLCRLAEEPQPSKLNVVLCVQALGQNI